MLNENLTLSEPDPPSGPVRLSWNPTFQGRYKTCRGSGAHESVANRQNSVLCAATGEVDTFATTKVTSRGYSNCGYTNPRTPQKQGKKLPKTIASSKRLFIEFPSKVASSSKRSRSDQKTGPAGYDLCGIEVELETVISKELLPHVDGQVR